MLIQVILQVKVETNQDPNFGNNIDLNKRFVKHEKRINTSKTKDILLNHKLKEYKCEICGLSV